MIYPRSSFEERLDRMISELERIEEQHRQIEMKLQVGRWLDRLAWFWVGFVLAVVLITNAYKTGILK